MASIIHVNDILRIYAALAHVNAELAEVVHIFHYDVEGLIYNIVTERLCFS